MINSLVNFGIPGLNGDRGPQLQPIMTNRFRVTFYNFGIPGEIAPYDLTRQVKRINRPNLTFETQTLYSYVSPIYISTRGEWQEMSVAFHDDITNAVWTRVQNQIAKQQNMYDQTLSRAGENYKFEMDLDILAGGATAGSSSSDPNIIQKWSYSGCQLVGIDGGELAYENANAAEIVCNIRYDNVIPFNQNGVRMGTYSHTAEILAQTGILSTGVGAGGLSISISGSSINVGVSGVSVGGVTLSGSTGGGASVSF